MKDKELAEILLQNPESDICQFTYYEKEKYSIGIFTNVTIDNISFVNNNL